MTQSPLTALAALVLVAAYLAVMLALGRRRTHHLDAEGFVVADRDVPLLSGTASMGTTWIWAASVFAAATAAYTYGPSGAFHYAFWGGLALLFVWRYGRRVRQLAPHGHTLSEFVRARHGRLSQGVMALEGYLNSQYSLVVNFTAAGALLSLLSPVSYQVAVIVVAVGVVAYTSLSGIRASITTDLVQMGAIALLAVVLVARILLAGSGRADDGAGFGLRVRQPHRVAAGVDGARQPAARHLRAFRAVVHRGGVQPGHVGAVGAGHRRRARRR
ncbi:MAG: hypothetical protein BRC31_07220 [Actinobacteria bacterium QS_5_72_10]|nr:MAG: hypothetical protein BRC31_07220 [Actinobacteria bacterium QS_5_72_10]